MKNKVAKYEGALGFSYIGVALVLIPVYLIWDKRLQLGGNPLAGATVDALVSIPWYLWVGIVWVPLLILALIFTLVPLPLKAKPIWLISIWILLLVGHFWYFNGRIIRVGILPLSVLGSWLGLARLFFKAWVKTNKSPA
jgi:hypothetical protein